MEKIKEIINELIKSGVVEKNEILVKIKDLIKVPEPEELFNQYLGRQADRYIAARKDENGERRTYSLKEDGKTEYIDLKNCSDLKKLEVIFSKLNQRANSLLKARDSVKIAINYVQLSFFQLEDENIYRKVK